MAADYTRTLGPSTVLTLRYGYTYSNLLAAAHRLRLGAGL